MSPLHEVHYSLVCHHVSLATGLRSEMDKIERKINAEFRKVGLHLALIPST